MVDIWYVKHMKWSCEIEIVKLEAEEKPKSFVADGAGKLLKSDKHVCTSEEEARSVAASIANDQSEWAKERIAYEKAKIQKYSKLANRFSAKPGQQAK